MREDQEQYQVQTHPGIGKPSPPTERCGTRQLTLLWARILLKKTEPFYSAILPWNSPERTHEKALFSHRQEKQGQLGAGCQVYSQLVCSRNWGCGCKQIDTNLYPHGADILVRGDR